MDRLGVKMVGLAMIIIISSAWNALIEVKPFKEELNCEKMGDFVTPSSLFTDLAQNDILHLKINYKLKF